MLIITSRAGGVGAAVNPSKLQYMKSIMTILMYRNRLGYKAFNGLLVTILICSGAILVRCGSEFEVLLDDGDMAYVYWAESGSGIKRITTGGDDLETVVSIPSPRVPLDMALYMPGKTVYWAEYSGSVFRIMRSGLDGSGEDLFYAYSSSPDHGPSAVAIDPGAGMIYWNQYQNASGHHDIWRSVLEVATPVKWLNAISNPYLYAYALALDTDNHSLYLSTASYWNISGSIGGGNNGAVCRGDTGIADTETVQISDTGWTVPSTPFMGIAVDPGGAHVYYADATEASNRIIRADLDVQNPTVWIEADGFGIAKIALDKRGGRIYWTSPVDTSIYRADIVVPESNVEKFLQLDGMPTDIAIVR